MSFKACGQRARKRARKSSSASNNAGPAAEAADRPEAPRAHMCATHARMHARLPARPCATLRGRAASATPEVRVEITMCFSYLHKAEFHCVLFRDNTTYHLYRAVGGAFGCARATRSVCFRQPRAVVVPARALLCVTSCSATPAAGGESAGSRRHPSAST